MNTYPGPSRTYPTHSHLEYVYPPPSDDVLANILNALQHNPAFYTQVLHLMNKMNLPPPFRPSHTVPITIDFALIKKGLKDKTKAAKDELLASDESEISGDEAEPRECHFPPNITPTPTSTSSAPTSHLVKRPLPDILHNLPKRRAAQQPLISIDIKAIPVPPLLPEAQKPITASVQHRWSSQGALKPHESNPEPLDLPMDRNCGEIPQSPPRRAFVQTVSQEHCQNGFLFNAFGSLPSLLDQVSF